MSGCVYKTPEETIRQKVEFAAPLLAADERVASDAGWLLQNVTPTDGTVRVVPAAFGDHWTEARLKGGAIGESYLVTAQAGTSKGRVVKRSFVLRIAARNDAKIGDRT